MTDKIKTRGPSDEYRDGWERIWGRPKTVGELKKVPVEERRVANGDSLPPFGADAADAESPLPERRAQSIFADYV